MDNTRKAIIAISLLAGGAVAPVLPASTVTVQEWQSVVAQLNEEVKVNPEIGDVNSKLIELLPKESLLERIIE